MIDVNNTLEVIKTYAPFRKEVYETRKFFQQSMIEYHKLPLSSPLRKSTRIALTELRETLRNCEKMMLDMQDYEDEYRVLCN